MGPTLGQVVRGANENPGATLEGSLWLVAPWEADSSGVEATKGALYDTMDFHVSQRRLGNLGFCSKGKNCFLPLCLNASWRTRAPDVSVPL